MSSFTATYKHAEAIGPNERRTKAYSKTFGENVFVADVLRHFRDKFPQEHISMADLDFSETD